MAEKGADLDQLFSFLSETSAAGDGAAGRDGGGGGRDELDFVDGINQDLDRMMGDEASPGGAAPPEKADKKKGAGKQAPAATVQPKASQPEKTKSKSRFKWKK